MTAYFTQQFRKEMMEATRSTSFIFDDIVEIRAVPDPAKNFSAGPNPFKALQPNYTLKPTMPQMPAPMFRLPAPGAEKWPEYLPPYTSKLGPPDSKVVETWVTPEQYEGYRGQLWTRSFITIGWGFKKLPEPFRSADNLDYERTYSAALQGELFCMLKVDSISTQVAMLRLKHEL